MSEHVRVCACVVGVFWFAYEKQERKERRHDVEAVQNRRARGRVIAADPPRPLALVQHLTQFTYTTHRLHHLACMRAVLSVRLLP